MTNVAVKDAKNLYIETGRLNRNIISKEISISWYKCKLQNIKPCEPFRHIGEKPTINFEAKFLDYVDTIVPQYFDYILVNMSLQKCASRMILSKFTEMDTIDDLAIGTNGGYLTYKTQTNQLVSLDEHYLDCLSTYYSYGVMIQKDDKMLGVLMLISIENPNEYDIAKLREKLAMFNSKSNVMPSEMSTMDESKSVLSHFFAYPDDYMSGFEDMLRKTTDNSLPILIKGSKGAGKSTLARYIAQQTKIYPLIVSLNETPRSLQKSYVENALSQNEAVIIESLESADSEVIKLLTIYTEHFLLGKLKDKSSNYKCLKLIVTTAYNNDFTDDIPLSKHQSKQLKKLMDRLKLNTVNLLNTSDFIDDIQAIANAVLVRNNVKATDGYRIKLMAYLMHHSFKSAQQMVEISIDDNLSEDKFLLSNFPSSISDSIVDLETYEKEYILKIYDMLDKNMTATASILNIGRSTLYRKLEKYQNETIQHTK